MRLYRDQSSTAAAATISKFSKAALGGSIKAIVFVEGDVGSKCLTYNGAGKSNCDWCQTSYNFFCEFNDKGFLVAKFHFL
jgi:hypothetical protein